MSHTIWASLDPGGRRLRPILFVFAVLLIVVNGALALAYLNDLHRANARADRSLQIMLVLKQIEDLSEQSGWGQRNYRVSGDVRQLDAYRAAQAELPAQLERLRQLVVADKDQLGQLASLTALIERDRSALTTELAPVEPRFSDGHLPAELATGVDRTHAIVAAIDAMLANGQRQLRDHLATMESRNDITLGAGMFIRTGAIALVVLLVVAMYRKARRNEELAAAQSGALLESEQRFRRVFEESPLGIVLAEPDSQRIVQANPAFCRMLGTGSEQIVNRTITDLAHVDDGELLDDAVRRGTGPDLGIEARYVTRSGAIAWASVRLAQLSASAGRPGLLLALTEDITRHKRVEAELRQAQKMEAIGQLTGGIAHDFNNLLGVIIGNVELLMDAVRGDQAQLDLVQEILDSALGGADLTRRLLAFARRQSLQPRQIDLNAYLPNNVAILRRLLGETVQVRTRLATDLWATRADPSQVGDALLNLAINARDAMPHGGQILIETANARLAADQHDAEVAPGDYVVLSVSDTGTGMPPEVLERVVEPFFTTKPPGAGSGLGLSMIFGFAKQSGGHLRIESEPGHGTTVRLLLPRAQSVEAGETAAEPVARFPSGNGTILLVDDSPEMRLVARRHLTSLGYQVREADSGPAALTLLRNGSSFDLLFTDIAMPEGMSGYQLAAAARQLRPGLKVLFTTGYARADNAYEEEMLKSGAMILKPYRKQELAATLRAVLEA